MNLADFLAESSTTDPFLLVETFIKWLSLLDGSPIHENSAIRDLINPYNIYTLLQVFFDEINTPSSLMNATAFFDHKYEIDLEGGSFLSIPTGLIEQTSVIERVIQDHIKRNEILDQYQALFTQLNFLKIILGSDINEITKLCKVLLTIAMVSSNIIDLCYNTLEKLDSKDAQLLTHCIEQEKIHNFAVKTETDPVVHNLFKLRSLKLAKNSENTLYDDEDAQDALRWENALLERVLAEYILAPTQPTKEFQKGSSVNEETAIEAV